MKTQPLVGTYHPALTAAESHAPDIKTDTIPPIATARCDILGVLKTEPFDTYLWSPFTSEEPNALLNVDSIKVLTSVGAPIPNAVLSVRLTAAGFDFEFDIEKIQRPVNDPFEVEMTPDESWPILQNTFAPKPGAYMLPFPSIWVYP